MCFPTARRAVLSALRAAGAWNRTPAVHRALRADGVPLSPVLATLLLACYGGSGSTAAAEGVLLELREGERGPGGEGAARRGGRKGKKGGKGEHARLLPSAHGLQLLPWHWQQERSLPGCPPAWLPLRAAGHQPNRTHWNALIYAHAEARDWAAARTTFGRMLAAGVAPDPYTMVALLRALTYEAAAREGKQRPAERQQQPPPAAEEGSPAGPLQPGQQQQQGGSAPAEASGSGCTAEVAWLQQEMRRHNVPATAKVATALLAYWLGVAQGWQPAGQEAREPPVPGAARGEGQGGEAQQAQQRAQYALEQARAIWKQLRKQQGAAEGAGAVLAARGDVEADESSAAVQQAQPPKQQQRRRRVPPAMLADTRAFNAMMEVQLAAGDLRGVLQTYEELQRSAGGWAGSRGWLAGWEWAAAVAAPAGQSQGRLLMQHGEEHRILK